MATKVKSIEDYRNAVKLLKLKVIKLQKQNDDLQEKLRDQGIAIETEQPKGDLNNQAVMQAFSRSCKRIGLTPEMLFRAADRESNGQMQSEDLRLFLQKVRLGLTPSQLTMLVRTLDEDCSGVIKKEEYYECLQAYGINEEKQAGQARTYGQEALLKYARLLIGAQISPEDSFGQLKSENVTPSQFNSFVHAIDRSNTISEKEVVAVFNHIDMNKQGTLSRSFYEQEVRKAMRVAAMDLGAEVTRPQPTKSIIKVGQISLLEPTPLRNQLQSQSQQPSRKGIPAISPIQPSGNNPMASSSMIQINEDILILNEDKRKDIQNQIGRLKMAGVDAIELIRTVIQNLEVPSAGVMLYDMFKELSKTKVPKVDQVRFFQALDLNENGSIDYDELMVFFVEFKGPHDEYTGLFEILTRKLQALGISIQSYLALEQIYDTTILDIDQFFHVAQVLFNTSQKKQSDLLFQSLDSDRSGQLSASEIIEQVRKVMDIYVPPAKTMVDMSMSMSKSMRNTVKNLGEFSQLIRRMKPILSEEDFFDRYRLEGQAKTLHTETTKWATIFNSEVACLRYCYEVMEKLDQNPGAKWEDPEFGPTKDDEYGSKSMYFADNDIPEGCPDPKECKWLRPEEYVANLAEAGHEDLLHAHIDVFDADGAASNDVCQSKYLGNCWFVSALSIISGYDKYLKGEFEITAENVNKIDDKAVNGMLLGVYPPCFQFLRHYGVYVFRFFKNFGWRFVVIDDRFCVKDNEYVYGHNRSPTEIWVNLIEKAYAKLHQCYFALTSGDIAQGLADMTGKTPDKIHLEENWDEKEKEKVWKMLLDCKRDGTMLGCSAEGGTELFIKLNEEDTGIMSGHAYGIIDVFELPDKTAQNYHKSHRLLKIRNPWGYGEWKLKWSENPDYADKLEKFLPAINAYYDKEIAQAKKEGREPPERYVTGVDDGTFLMSFKGWRTVFHNLFQCIDFPDDWSGSRAFDKFGLQGSGAPTKSEASQIAYAQKNPQFILELKKKTTLYIQMQQIDGRLFFGERYPYQNVMKPILLCVFKIDNDKCLQKFDQNRLVANSGKFNLRREIDSDEIELAPGRYAVIPCTKDPCPLDFTLSFYFNCQKQEINITKYGDARFKLGVITEEEEEVSKASDDLKKLLKKQAEDVLKG